MITRLERKTVVGHSHACEPVYLGFSRDNRILRGVGSLNMAIIKFVDVYQLQYTPPPLGNLQEPRKWHMLCTVYPDMFLKSNVRAGVSINC